METKSEVKKFEVNMTHSCGGVMIATHDPALLSNPPKYPHQCNECGFSDYYTKLYPHIEMKKVDQLKEEAEARKKALKELLIEMISSGEASIEIKKETDYESIVEILINGEVVYSYGVYS